jgi:hypothetical protein
MAVTAHTLIATQQTPADLSSGDVADSHTMPVELLVLAFADATHAEAAARQLSAMQPEGPSVLSVSVILTKDSSGRGGCSLTVDFVRRARPLPTSVRRAVMRLLPGPLGVLTGRSAGAHQHTIDTPEPLLTSDDFDLLARCLAVDSSVLLLLIERSVMTDIAERIARIDMAAKAGRLQVTLDSNVERFMAASD